MKNAISFIYNIYSLYFMNIIEYMWFRGDMISRNIHLKNEKGQSLSGWWMNFHIQNVQDSELPPGYQPTISLKKNTHSIN